MTLNGHTHTESLADWAANLKQTDIPDHVHDATRLLVLDHIACSIGGRDLSPAQIMLGLSNELGGSPQATVFATGESTSVLEATYLNAALSNLLDFDDSYPGAGHPGGTVIPAAVAVAEANNLTLGDLLTAVVAGYEVSIRIGTAIRPSPERFRSVAGYSVWQALGSTAAAGHLLRLNTEQFRHAFGLGALNAPVPNMRKLGLEPEERPFSWTKNNYGWAARGGTLGSMLASRGFLGNRQIFDGESGFWAMASSDQFKPDVLTGGLGSEWLTPRTGFKPYASCRWTHTAIDAVTQFKDAHPEVSTDDIDSITLGSFFEVADNLSGSDPTDIVDAQFNVRHVMALELTGRSPRFGLKEEDLTNPEIVDLRHRTQVIEEAHLSEAYLSERKMPAALTVRTKQGQEYQQRVDELPGSPARPMSNDELDQKHRALISPVIGETGYERLRDFLLSADSSEPVRASLRGALDVNVGA